MNNAFTNIEHFISDVRNYLFSTKKILKSRPTQCLKPVRKINKKKKNPYVHARNKKILWNRKHRYYFPWPYVTLSMKTVLQLSCLIKPLNANSFFSSHWGGFNIEIFTDGLNVHCNKVCKFQLCKVLYMTLYPGLPS